MAAGLGIDAFGGKLRGLVLASGSPRRQELLSRIGLRFTVAPSNVDEAIQAGELPEPYARRIAEDKARPCAKQHDQAFVLAADTVVSIYDRILGKPDHETHARTMLADLSGRTHQVITAYTIWGPGLRHARTVTTEVDVVGLSSRELDAYLASGEWQGKAGGYAIQGIFAYAVTSIRGSYTNVVGLPLAEVVQDLVALGAVPDFPADGFPL